MMSLSTKMTTVSKKKTKKFLKKENNRGTLWYDERKQKPKNKKKMGTLWYLLAEKKQE